MAPAALSVVTGAVLIGLGLHGAWTGTVVGRIGRVARAAHPGWFWFRVGLYLAAGAFTLAFPWLRGP